MSTLKDLFTAHPASVDEGYFEHMGQALGFAGRLAIATFVCLVHAVLPFLFVKSGSRAITELHDRMVTNRNRRRRQQDVIGSQAQA